VRQEHGKLVAADAEGPIRSAQRGVQQLSKSAQHPVAAGVPPAVVDGLELVQVE
jgi:hypothetical protein